MIALYIFATLLTVVTAGSFFQARRTDFDSVGWIVLGFLVGVCAVIAILIAIITPISRKLDENECYAWGRQTDREARFSAYAYGGLQWDCFVRTSDGRWLPKSQLRDIAP